MDLLDPLHGRGGLFGLGLEVGAWCLASQQHDALGVFSTAMLSFVVPITVITLVVSVLRGKSQAAA